MYKYLDVIISFFKKEKFVLDRRIPLSYVSYFCVAKIFQMLWGCLIFHKKWVYLHYTSTVRCKSKIKCGRNLIIDRNCYIDALSVDGIILGDNVSIGRMTTILCTGNLKYLGKGLAVGNNVGLGTRGHYGGAGGIVIGSDTIIGDYVSIHSENHNYTSADEVIRLQGVTHKGVVIGSNCWIGAKVTILDGTRIGDGCVVAAGSVVRGEIPSNSVVAGIPAKLIKKRTVLE